jgi:glycerol-3-phosphate acyltransferase PlsY
VLEGEQAARALGWVLVSYLAGSISFGRLFALHGKGVDPATSGSGSTGATNVARQLGLSAGIAVALLDLGKGWLAVFLVLRFGDELPHAWRVAVVVAVVCGHVWPVFHRFRGGKGVATTAGAMLILSPVTLAGSLAVFGFVLLVFRYVSAASLTAALTLPLWAAAFAGTGSVAYTGALVLAPLILWTHRGNLLRLQKGTEPRLGSLRSK